MNLDQIVRDCCRGLALVVAPTLPLTDPPTTSFEGLFWREVRCKVTFTDVTDAIRILCQDAQTRPAIVQFYRLTLLGPDLGVKQYRAETEFVSVRLTRHYYPQERIVFDYLAR